MHTFSWGVLATVHTVHNGAQRCTTVHRQKTQVDANRSATRLNNQLKNILNQCPSKLTPKVLKMINFYRRKSVRHAPEQSIEKYIEPVPLKTDTKSAQNDQFLQTQIGPPRAWKIHRKIYWAIAIQNWPQKCSKWSLFHHKMKQPRLNTDPKTVQNGHFCITKWNNHESKLITKLFKMVSFAEQLHPVRL